MHCARVLNLVPLLFFLPWGLNAQIASIQRTLYGSPLIDSLPRNQFPRGGAYTAVIQGVGLSHVTGFVASNPNVSGSVSSASDTSVTVQINSTAVVPPGGDIWGAGTANAPIPGVAFSLSQTPPPGQPPLGPISSGSVTFDIVVGPIPQLSNYKVTNSIKWIPASIPVTVKYSIDILHAGNIYGWAIWGCGPCVGAFGGGTGSQFTNHVEFEAAVNAPNDFTFISFPFWFAAITGAGARTDGEDPAAKLTLPVVQTQLVDPVPTLMNGTTITSDASRLFTQGTVVTGVAADGISTLVVRIAGAPANESFTFTSAQDGQLTNVGSTAFGPSISVQADADGHAFLLYRAPLDFVRSGTGDDAASTRTVDLKFSSSDSPGTEGDTQVSIVRPPVILVHGLWDSNQGWDNFAPLTTDSRFWIRRVDYSRPVPGVTASSPAFTAAQLASIKQNSMGFAYNAPKVLSQIKQYISEYKTVKSVAATQADIVAHSMGGDISRTLRVPPTLASYLSSDTFGQGPIHKIITIGTPHLGSPVATQLLQAQNSCIRNLLAKAGNIAVTTVAIGSSLYGGGAGDLQGDGTGGALSQALLNMRSSSGPPVPTALIAGSMTAANLSGLSCTLCVAEYIRHHCKTDPLAVKLTSAGWPTVFGQSSDAIVPHSSQVNGSFGIDFYGVVHSGGTQKLSFNGPSELDQAPGIPARVIDLLNQATTGVDFRAMR